MTDSTNPLQIGGITVDEGREFVLTEDNDQLGDMVATDNLDPDGNTEPSRVAPLSAGSVLEVVECNHYPDGWNVLFSTDFAEIELNEFAIKNCLADGLLKPVSDDAQ